MTRRLSLALLALVLAGCADEPEIILVAEDYAVVSTSDGKETLVPLGDLFDHDTGAAAFERVLVVDRQTNRRMWIHPDQLMSAGPMQSRYVPVTRSAPADDAATAGSPEGAP